MLLVSWWKWFTFWLKYNVCSARCDCRALCKQKKEFCPRWFIKKNKIVESTMYESKTVLLNNNRNGLSMFALRFSRRTVCLLPSLFWLHTFSPFYFCFVSSCSVLHYVCECFSLWYVLFISDKLIVKVIFSVEMFEIQP